MWEHIWTEHITSKDGRTYLIISKHNITEHIQNIIRTYLGHAQNVIKTYLEYIQNIIEHIQEFLLRIKRNPQKCPKPFGEGPEYSAVSYNHITIPIAIFLFTYLILGKEFHIHKLLITSLYHTFTFPLTTWVRVHTTYTHFH